jgi:hypothetical protein
MPSRETQGLSLNLPNFREDPGSSAEVSGSSRLFPEGKRSDEVAMYSYKNQVDLFPEGKRNPGGVIEMHHTIVSNKLSFMSQMRLKTLNFYNI